MRRVKQWIIFHIRQLLRGLRRILMLCKIVEIHKEEHIEEELVEGFWRPVDYVKVDVTYSHNDIVKRGIFRFRPSSWEFDKQHGKFIIF